MSTASASVNGGCLATNSWKPGSVWLYAGLRGEVTPAQVSLYLDRVGRGGGGGRDRGVEEREGEGAISVVGHMAMVAMALLLYVLRR
jgi:hypothetical protein